MDGIKSTTTFKSKRITANGHPAVIRARKFKTSTGVIEAGTLIAINGSKECVKYDKTFTQDIGTGDDTTKTFTATLTNTQVQPGSVVISVNAGDVLVDNGLGGFIGAEGSGTIDYKTGYISIALTAAPANGVTVAVSHANKLEGVLTTDIDFETDDASNVLSHGAVVGESLMVGSSEAAQEDFDALDAIGIYVQ